MINGMKYMTAAGIAHRAKVDKETVRRWCRDQDLPAIKIGKEWLVEEETVINFLEIREAKNK